MLKDENGHIIYEQEYEPKYVKEKVPVYVYENYTQSTSDENSANDYGQVTYTAVKNINFTNTSWNPDSVHLYVQNQQKIEATQTALAILNMIDYSRVRSLDSLKMSMNPLPKISLKQRAVLLQKRKSLKFWRKRKILY